MVVANSVVVNKSARGRGTRQGRLASVYSSEAFRFLCHNGSLLRKEGYGVLETVLQTPVNGLMGHWEATIRVFFIRDPGGRHAAYPSSVPLGPHRPGVGFAGASAGLLREARAPTKVARQAEGRNRDPSAAVIDSQAVKGTGVGGPERGYDGAKRLSRRKRHLLWWTPAGSYWVRMSTPQASTTGTARKGS